MSDLSFRRVSVRSTGLSLRILEAGPENGPLVLFLHGFPDHAATWTPQLVALAKLGFHAVAPEMRGYGDSDKPPEVEQYSLNELAADIAQLISSLGHTQARAVVGHDWGGAVTWHFAAQFPALTQQIAILNSPHPIKMTRALQTWKQLQKSWYMGFFQLPWLPEFLLRFQGFSVIKKGLENDGWAEEDVESLLSSLKKPGVLKGGINYYRAMVRDLITGNLPEPKKIECPVLVIWGDRDRYLGRELASPPSRWVPHCKVVHLPKATHWVQYNEPDRVSELLAQFIAPVNTPVNPSTTELN